MSDLKFRATVDSKKGEVSLTNLDKGVDKVAKTTTRAGAGFKKLAIGIAAGVAAFAVASRALQGLVRWTAESVKGAIDAEKAEKKLEVVLKSTGEAAGITKDELVEMAKALQDVTTYEDDVIMGAEHLLLTFTNIGKEVFPEALETVLNMAQAMGTDLRGASIQLGKALQDPILGATALRRVGVNLSASMMDQIKTFVESGKIMQAQKLILAELATEFGGTARAVTDTFGGSLIQLKNTFRALQDEVGEAIIANDDFGDSIKQITELSKDLIDSGLVQWVTDIAIQAVKSMPMLQSLAYSLGAILLIYKIQAEKLKKVDERTVEWIGHLQLEDDLQRSLRGQIAEVIEVTEEQAGATEHLTGKVKLLHFSMEALWRSERMPSEIMEGWDRLFDLVETSGLDLIWEQQMQNMEQDTLNFMAKIIPGMEFMTEDYKNKIHEIITANELLKQSWGLTSDSQLAFAETMIGEFVNMEANLQGFVAAIMNTFEQWAIGQLIPTIMAALPFPANLLAVGGAILAIKSIFAGVRSGMESEPIEGKAGGGWVGLHGPEIIKVGERGPEWVTKTSEVQNIINRTDGAVTINLIIQDQLDPYTAQRITREQIIPQILESLDINENKIKFRERLGI